MLSLKTKSSGLSRDRKRKDEQSLVETRVARFSDESGYRLGRSRREFLRAASGIAAVFLGVNRVYGRVFEVRKPEPTASGQFISDDAPLDVARFAAEHWNPLMLEELYLEQKRFK